jgi:hypothetical protein
MGGRWQQCVWWCAGSGVAVVVSGGWGWLEVVGGGVVDWC